MPYDPSFIERSPAFYKKPYDPEDLQHYLNDQHFLYALQLASEALFNEVEKKLAQNLPLSSKEIISLKKYINRIHFRATPFGLFSVVGPGSWQYHSDTDAADVHQTELTVQTFSPLHKPGELKNTIITANSSGYLMNNEIRFLVFTKNTEGQFKWEVKSLEASDPVKKIWKLCKEEQTVDNLLNFIVEKFHLGADDARDALHTLIESQVLYYKGCASPLNYQSQKVDTFEGNLTELLPKIKAANPGKRSAFLVNTFNNAETQLNSRHLKSIDNALAVLGFLVSDNQVPQPLNDFILKFEKLYDRRMVPLLEALDPEIGVGYDDKDLASVQINEIVQQVSSNQKERGVFSSSWTAVHSLLLKKMQAGGDIELFDHEIKADGKVIRSEGSMPPGLSVTFRVDNKQRVVIESAGGAACGALLGRFTSNIQIDEIARRLAGYEVQNNPGVVFAEIDCRTDEKYNKFNFRNNTYPHSISIGYNDAEHIALNDIHLCYSNGELQLYSKKLSARVIPRLTSAYNYKLNELPVYRFLCDMQFSGIKHNYIFSLKKYFPGLPYYPAVIYKNTVIEPASWELDRETVLKFKGGTFEKAAVILDDLVKRLSIPNQIRILETDQYLVFDLAVKSEKKFFIECIQQATGAVVLQEFNFLGTRGNNGLKQFIAFKYADRASYSKFELPGIRPRKLPHAHGVNNWVYLKIYCHPNAANQIIGQHLLPIVKKLEKELDRWFYINYYDPEYHIRFRLNLNSKYVTAAVQQELAPVYKLEHQGLVKRIEIQSYMPEYERYGVRQIVKAEDVFHRDSEYCVYLLSHIDLFSPEFLYLTILSVHLVYEHLKWDINKRIDFSKNSAVINSNDAKEIANFFHQSNQLYREHEKALRLYILSNYDKLNATTYAGNYHQRISDYIKALPPGKKSSIMNDLFHMHLNRLFTSSNRLHEAMVHHWLSKFYKSAVHIK